MTTGLLGSAVPLAQAYDIALLDLDGTCFAGSARVPYAAEGVARARQMGMATCFVTNNASRPPATVAQKLTDLDIPTEPAEVFTSSMDAAAILAERLPAGSLVLVVGSDGLREPLEDAGFRVTLSAEDHPVAVVQGWAPHLGWAELSEAVYAIADGALHVATNLDATLPTERGFALGNGSLVAAVANATGVTPLAGGKPLPGIYRRALARSGGRLPLAVGDRLNTDLAGARAADIPGLHVLTGVSDARDVILSDPAYRPCYLHTDLRGMSETHPGPEPTEGWWAVGARRARVTGRHLQVDGGPDLTPGTESPESPGYPGSPGTDGTAQDTPRVTLDLDAYRAAVAAAWAHLDAGGALAVPPIDVTAP